MNGNCGIYAISSPAGKQYIGQTVNFTKRWAEHRRLLRRGRHHCVALQRAWNKYGESRMKFAKIAIVTVGDLDSEEQRQIDIRPRAKLYNTAFDVKAVMRGRTPDLITRAKLSASLSGRIFTPEHRTALSDAGRLRTMSEKARAALLAANLGVKHSAETRLKMSLAHRGEKNFHFGKPVSAERRAKQSAAMKGKYAGEKSANFGKPKSAEHRAKLSAALTGKVLGEDQPLAKTIICKETGAVFKTCTAAVYWLRENINPKADLSTICKAGSGKLKKAYGFTWAYINKEQAA